MKKSLSLIRHFSPLTLFLYGTYKEDGTPNFGMFSWLNYCVDKEVGVIACIGGEKLTKDRIRANKVFSANLVSEELLPLADYFGNTSGYNKDKSVRQSYFRWDGTSVGSFGEPMKEILNNQSDEGRV